MPACAVAAALGASRALAAQQLHVVAGTTDLADIAKAVGGRRVSVVHISEGYQDPHFVEAKPSFILQLRDADVFAYVGLDLEIGWMPLRRGRAQPENPGWWLRQRRRVARHPGARCRPRPGGPQPGRRAFGYVPQRDRVDYGFPLTVIDVVTMGRHHRIGLLKRPSAEDRRLAYVERIALVLEGAFRIGRVDESISETTLSEMYGIPVDVDSFDGHRIVVARAGAGELRC